MLAAPPFWVAYFHRLPLHSGSAQDSSRSGFRAPPAHTLPRWGVGVAVASMVD
jgi:hypothetical protein